MLHSVGRQSRGLRFFSCVRREGQDAGTSCVCSAHSKAAFCTMTSAPLKNLNRTLVPTPDAVSRLDENAYNWSASFSFNLSIPSPFAAEIGTTSILGNRFLNAFKLSCAAGK